MPKIKISAMIGQCLDRRLRNREKPYAAVKSMPGRSEGTVRSRAGGLMVHDGRRTDQTEITLPINIKVMTC